MLDYGLSSRHSWPSTSDGPHWIETICGSASHIPPTASRKSAVAQIQGPVLQVSPHVFQYESAELSGPAVAGIRQGPAIDNPCLKPVVLSALLVPPDALAAAESVTASPREPHVRRQRRRNCAPRPTVIPVERLIECGKPRKDVRQFSPSTMPRLQHTLL